MTLNTGIFFHGCRLLINILYVHIYTRFLNYYNKWTYIFQQNYEYKMFVKSDMKGKKRRLIYTLVTHKKKKKKKH